MADTAGVEIADLITRSYNLIGPIVFLDLGIKVSQGAHHLLADLNLVLKEPRRVLMDEDNLGDQRPQ